MYVKAPNIPPNPSTVTSRDSQTWPERNAPSSPRSPASSRETGCDGMRVAMPISARTPITVIAQKVERQPSCCPSSVPNGTPSTLAVVSPANIIAMAPALFSGATSLPATTAPMPKNAPWVSAARHPAEQHHLVGRGDRGDEVARDEQHHQRGEDVLAVEPGHRRGQADGADGDAQGVARDQPAGRRLVDAVLGRHLGEQARNDELGEPDAEAPDGQGEECEGHGVPFSCDGRGRRSGARAGLYAACATTSACIKLVADAACCKCGL